MRRLLKQQAPSGPSCSSSLNFAHQHLRRCGWWQPKRIDDDDDADDDPRPSFLLIWVILGNPVLEGFVVHRGNVPCKDRDLTRVSRRQERDSPNRGGLWVLEDRIPFLGSRGTDPHDATTYSRTYHDGIMVQSVENSLMQRLLEPNVINA